MLCDWALMEKEAVAEAWKPVGGARLWHDWKEAVVI